ncbi:MAG TPA: glucose-6-phosphate dehydrogenase assembly protein OpcA [Ktedonobacteraceae bacterium]|jgi:glucose-6-phosphate dehydrogenase assembly protein OpcA|nr:glucose-6-phosphate dehydrogenase assembly protein OpcA [Ktedonobacteraceae bacterium]
MAKEITDTLGPRLPWAGKHVAPEFVEDELSRLWHMSADNMRTSQNLRVRTSVLNLVLCASNKEVAQQASALLRDLSSTHVARVILLILDQEKNAPSEVSTWITIRSFPIISDIMRHNFEQITVRVTGDAVASSSTIIQPLLKPDLPVYLWWVDDLPTNTQLFKQLASMSSRVIVDSSQFSQPEDSLRTLSSLVQSLTSDSALSDLNWGRITPWRELVAQFFDVTEYKPYLAGVDYIEIEHAVTLNSSLPSSGLSTLDSNPACALFLAAWLKTRLGWHVISDHEDNMYDPRSGTYSWHMRRSQDSPKSGALRKTIRQKVSRELTNVPKQEGDADGILSLTPREEIDIPIGSICSIRLISNVGARQAAFVIDLEDSAGHVSTSGELSQGTQSPQRTVSIASIHKASELLHDELEIMGRDYLYEETLHEVFDLLA